MILQTAILGTAPTSFWPLTDIAGAICRDEIGLHDARVNSAGVKLAAVPFGAASVPYFDGEIGSVLTVADDTQYSQPYANALSVAAWICPLALDNAHWGLRRSLRAFSGKGGRFLDRGRMGDATLQSIEPKSAFKAFVLHI
jgi:hypothetical protein